MRIWISSFYLIFITLFFAEQASSQVPLTGYFIAVENCQAHQSFRKGTNPGNIELIQDMSYELIAKNKVKATHYRIRVKDARPQERWVSAACGFILTDCKSSNTGTGTSTGETPSGHGGRQPEYLLAISWQPAFCQTHQYKIECETQDENRYDASNFTLHGLWPQPRSNVYCNVSNLNKSLDKRKLWDRLPRLDISSETYEDLIEVMPGVASYLQRHEWIKHGTCYSITPEEYFAESILLVEQINSSAVRDYFADNIGKSIPISQIKTEFDKAFGSGAGDKVKVKCSNGMITELWINLKGEITLQSELSTLLKHAETADSKCRNGLVDPVGY